MGELSEIRKGEQRGKLEISKTQSNQNLYPVFNGGKTPSGYTSEFNRENLILISEGGASAGFVNYYQGKFWSGGHNFTLEIKHVDTLFIKASLNALQERLYSLQVGSGLPNIQLKDLKVFSITAPKTSEQNKIGTLFSNIDHLITLQQCERHFHNSDAKSSFSEIISHHIEGITAIIFHSYTNTWEQRKLKDITTESFGGGTPKTSVEEYWKGNIPWFQSKDIIEDKLFDNQPQKFITKEAIEKSATKLIPSNSIAIVTRVGVGKLSLIPYQFCTSQDFHSLSELLIDEKFAVYAIYKLLQSEKVNAQGTSIKGITTSELLSKSLFIPCDKSEQKSIGSFFSALDHLITLQQCKPLMFISLTLKAIS